MKLAIVRQKYTPFGGAERFVERAIAALARSGIDVTIVSRRWQDEVGPGVGSLCLDPFYLGRTWRDAGFARAVQSLIASGRFDLLQSHERIPGCQIYRAGDGVHATWLELRRAGRGSGGEMATWLSPWHRYTLRAEARMFRDPALRAVICNSQMVRDDIAGRFDVAADRLHVIYNGVDLRRFHPGLRELHRAELRDRFGVPKDRNVVLFVGSGFERKGVPSLLDALREIDAELWVVGRDKATLALGHRAEQLGIAGRVRFFGGQTDVAPYYGAADVFALPTLYDPLPNAALEALASGLPVLTTRTCGAAELIDEASGRVVDAGDVAAIAAGLSALGLDAGDRRVAARAAVAHLEFDNMAQRLIALYAALGLHG